MSDSSDIVFVVSKRPFRFSLLLRPNFFPAVLRLALIRPSITPAHPLVVDKCFPSELLFRKGLRSNFRKTDSNVHFKRVFSSPELRSKEIPRVEANRIRSDPSVDIKCDIAVVSGRVIAPMGIRDKNIELPRGKRLRVSSADIRLQSRSLYFIVKYRLKL